MKKLNCSSFCLIIVPLILISTNLAQTNILGGEISGIWILANSPYQINGEVTIPNDSTLIIEPGVEVVFMGHYKFNVQGRLLAVGTKQDSIRFTAENTLAGWHGIRFNQTPTTNDSSKFFYCSFKNGKANTGSGFDRCGGAVFINEFDKILISDCLFDSNVQVGESWIPPYEAGPAIYFLNCSPVITNSTFINNDGHKSGAITCLGSPEAIISNNILTKNKGLFGPIVCDWEGSPTISGNIITKNFASYAAGGILVYLDATPTISGNLISYNTMGGIGIADGSTPRIENNIIVHNYETGVACADNSSAVLINNTIAFNNSPSGGGGVWCDGNSDPIFMNNILYGNTSNFGNQVAIVDTSSDPHFKNCDIQGGKEGFDGDGDGANYSGDYEENIDADPLFINIVSDTLVLSDSSPCIGTGTFGTTIAGTWYHPLTYCFMGNSRPSPAGSNPDIGACENNLGTVRVGEEQSILTEFVLYQNYPNPFNPITSIQYTIGNRQFVSLKVFDILGNEVAVLVNEEKPAGSYEVTWNAEGLSSGVYFYTLKAGEFTATKKLLLLK